MKIQVITGNDRLEAKENITISDYSRPSALDDFDINYIDLSYEGIWHNDGFEADDIDINDDLMSISMMVLNSKKTKIVYVFPQNVNYRYNFDEIEGYVDCSDIKSIVNKNNNHISILKCFPPIQYFNRVYEPSIMFEPTKTSINNTDINADFHFVDEYGYNIRTKSRISDKATTISIYNYYYTTLNICDKTTTVELFAEELMDDCVSDDFPEWVVNFDFDDDSKQRQIIINSEEIINAQQDRIHKAKEKLIENNRYKSVLCNNGEKLVKVVFEILEEILDCDLSGFSDVKQEDFRIEKEEVVLIGEIKGISSNVKNEHISQLEVHYQKYMDEIEFIENKKNAHAILIINPFKAKNMKDREPINEQQVMLAQKYNSLIVETSILLKMLELFREGKLSTEECLDVFSSKSGLLSLKDLEFQ